MIDLIKNWGLFFFLKFIFRSDYHYNPIKRKENVKSDTIWVFWEQGFENAPEIVRKCILSIKEYNKTQDVVFLSKDNIADYVQIPDFIMEKHEKGVINYTFFSDVIRLLLLRTYGGYWIDATCMFSAEMPVVIKNSSFFMFEVSLVSSSRNPILMSNWFIKSDCQNPLLCKMTDVLLGWWQSHNLHISYFIFHIIMSMLIMTDSESKKVWNNKIYMCNMQPHILQFSFGKDYEPKSFDFMISQSFVHKLTYKFNKKMLENDGINETVLKHLLKI